MLAPPNHTSHSPNTVNGPGGGSGVLSTKSLPPSARQSGSNRPTPADKSTASAAVQLLQVQSTGLEPAENVPPSVAQSARDCAKGAGGPGGPVGPVCPVGPVGPVGPVTPDAPVGPV